MFPQSLQKNIRELDKQITLLESECENMSTDKRKTGNLGKMSSLKEGESAASKTTREDVERRSNVAPRVSTARLVKKSPGTEATYRECPRSTVATSNKFKKPAATRETTTTNELSRVKKASYLSRNDRTQTEKKKTSMTSDNAYRKHHNKDGDSLVNENLDSDNEKQVLHKEVLIKPRGTAKVAAAQKPAKIESSTAKGLNFKTRNEAAQEKSDSDSSMTKAGQKLSTVEEISLVSPKWSEILSQEQHDNDMKNRVKTVQDSSPKPSLPLGSKCKSYYEAVPNTHALVRECCGPVPSMRLYRSNDKQMNEMWNDENIYPQSASSAGLRKPRVTSPFRGRNIENIIDSTPRSRTQYHDKGIQCGGDDKSSISDDSFDPIRTMCHLIEALKENFSGDDAKKLLKQLELSLIQLMEEWPIKNNEKEKVDYIYEVQKQENEYVKKLQRHFLETQKLCDNLTTEKNKLAEDLALKEHLLATLDSKEKEYLAVITNLKVNLEKKRFLVDENLEALKELNAVKNELLKETKIGEGLRKSHWKMQEEIQKCMLENDKLKTEIRLQKLEAQKFHFLLAGKDVEIRKYKEDVEALQRQISDQLATLRSKKSSNEVQKAMEAIMKQSEDLSMTDGESVVSEPQSKKKDGTIWKQRDRMMHSSPTSRASSVSDSLWNRISSIRGDELKRNEDDELKRNEENDELKSNEPNDELKSNEPNDELSNEENEELKSNDEDDGIFVGDSKLKRQTSGGEEPKPLSFASCNSDYSSDESAELDECTCPHLTKKLQKEIEQLFDELKENCHKNVITHPDGRVEILQDVITAGTADISARLIQTFERHKILPPSPTPDHFVPLKFL